MATFAVHAVVGDRQQAVVVLRTTAPLLSVCHIYDAEGHELVLDRDADMKYTVVLNRKALRNAGEVIDESYEEVSDIHHGSLGLPCITL